MAATASGLPQRGAFSAHLLLGSPGPMAAVRSASLPPPLSSSAPSSPRSGGYEYVPESAAVERDAPVMKRASAPSRIPLPQPRDRPPVRSSAAVAPLRRASAVLSTASPRDPVHAVAPSPRSPPSLPRASKRGSVSSSVLGIDPSAGTGICVGTGTGTGSSSSTLESPARQSRETAGAPAAASVLPIDTLAKKLRQQALELTGVYEQLEEKSEEVAARDAQLQELRLQLEKLRGAKKVVSSAPGSSAKRLSLGTTRTLARAGSSGTGGGGGGGASAAAKSKAAAARTSEVETLQHQVRELERERSRFESATRRVEDAIAVLKQHEAAGARARDVSEGDGDGSDAAPDALREQQLYIRVLEEAVHLKAFELRVTGHEELLVVLAELRHTIYEQERDVAAARRQLAALQQQQSEQLATHLTLEQQLDAKSTRRELELHELRQERTALAAQLAQTQRQLEREREQRQRLQAAADAREERLAHASEQLTSAAQLKTLAETKCETLARALDELRGSAAQAASDREREAEDARREREDAARTQSQLEAAKALQEELLRSVDGYAGSTEAAVRESERLRAQLQAAQDEARSTREALATAHAELASRVKQLSETQEQLSGTTARVSALERQVQDERAQAAAAVEEQAAALEASERQRGEFHESMRELSAGLAAAVALSQPPGADESGESGSELLVSEQLELSARSLDHLLAADGDSWTQHVPPLRGFLRQLRDAVVAAGAELEARGASWQRERSHLHVACDELQATARLCDAEMRQTHEALASAQTQLAQVADELADSRRESRWLQHERDELAPEVERLRAAEQQAAAQQQLLETQARRLEETTRELQRAEATERTLAAALRERREELRAATSALSELEPRAQRLALVEDALESAVALAERQNRKSQRLRETLAARERASEEQDARLAALHVQHQAVAERVRALFQRSVDTLRADAQAAGQRERLETFEREAQRGDVARLLQLLPALLEDVAAAQSDDVTLAVAINSASPPSALGGRSASKQQPVAPTSAKRVGDGDGDSDAACFEEQLALVREAFGAFRHRR